MIKRMLTKNSVASRMFIAVLLVSLVATLLTTAVRAWFDYREAMNEIEMRTRQVESIELPVIIENLWVMDLKTVRITLEGILNIPNIRHVSIEDKGRLIAEAGRIELGRVMRKEFPLVYLHGDKKLSLGVMKIDISMNAVYEQMLENMWKRIFYQAILILIISLLIFFLFQRMVTRHLSQIASYVKHLEGKRLEGNLLLREKGPSAEEPDEIDSIVLAINSMNLGLKNAFNELQDEITERKRVEEELVRLYQQVKDEAEISTSLVSTFQALNSNLDERELIKTVVNVAPRYLKFDRMGIFLYDERAGSFVFSGGYGFDPAEEGILLSRNFRVGDFPAMDKAVKGETVVIENALATDLMSKELVDTFGTKAVVIVPVSAREKVIGGIYSDYRTSRPIEERDISFLKGLADGIAIALQNSRLYRESIERLMELSGKIETIKAMAHLDREILSTIDRGTILRSAVALVSRIIPCERAAVLLVEGDNYRVISEWGVGDFLDSVYSVKKSHFDAPGMKANSLFIPDLTSDGAGCLYHGAQNAIGIKSSLMVPLVTKGEMIGFLDIGSTFHGRLAPEHLSTAENIASLITVALENARLYEELQQLLINTITSLASAIDAKSPWTKGHSERVTKYAVEIGKEMGLKEQELERLNLSGLLHDVGKIGTYDLLLDKLTELTDEEFELVKKHPRKGAEILGPIKQLSDIIPGVHHHHERYDGKGYPDGLKGEEIPLQARILCVADSFDSMTADRPYRPSPGKEYAISEFKRCSGTQFDPNVVEAFLRVLNRRGE
jgi:GAF domain-containing protein